METGTAFERDARHDTSQRSARGLFLLLFLLILGGLGLGAAASAARTGQAPSGAARSDDLGRPGRRW